MYDIKLTKRAKKELAGLPKREQHYIRKRIEQLTRNPKPSSFKELQGKWKGYYRIRSGNYRILYQIRDHELIVIVIRICHRSKVYR